MEAPFAAKQKTPRARRGAIVCALWLSMAAAVACSEAGPPPGVDELIIHDLVVGDGKEVVAGKRVSVHYSGWLYDPSAERNRGTPFDSSRLRGLPFMFAPLPGEPGIIEGWHRGVLGMKVGGVRELIIPPDLAYGDNTTARGVIGPGSTLVFEIELIKAWD